MTSTMHEEIKSEPLEHQSLIITEEIQIKEEQFEDLNFDEKNKIKNEPEECFEISFDVNSFACDMCPQVFDKKIKLMNHKRAHNRNGFSCVKCKKKFKLKNNFDTHSCNFQCLTCGKAFLRRDNLRQHETYVHAKWSKSELFSCDHCNKGFKYRKSLVCHMKQHMQDKPLTCGVCGKGFSVNNTFRQHLLTHDERFPCKICGKMLKHSALYYHTKQAHETRRVYSCNSCEATFESKKELTNHLLVHNDRFVCGICDKKFGKLYKLRQHLFLHENPNAYLCQICDKNFTRKDILENHLRAVHSKVPFRCTLCNFKSVKKCELKIHLTKIHGNFKGTRKESDAEDLFVEEPKKESEDNYVPCSECTKAFLGLKSLKIHQMKSHAKSTNCELCESKFNSKRDMLKHLKSVHKI